MELERAALAALRGLPDSLLLLFDSDGRRIGAFGEPLALAGASDGAEADAVRRAVALARAAHEGGSPAPHVVAAGGLRAVAFRVRGSDLVACHVQPLAGSADSAQTSSRLEAVARHFGHFVCEVDESGLVTYAGEGSRERGLEAEDVVRGSIAALIARLVDAESAAVAMRSLEKFVASQRPLEPFSVEGRDPQGRVRRLIVSGRWYDAPGSDRRGILLFRDAPATESAAGERSVALTHLAGSLVDAVLELSRTGTILSAAPLPGTWAGAREKLEGRSVLEFIHPEDQERATLDLNHAGAGSTFAPAIYRWRAVEGGWRSVETRAVVYAHADGERIIAVGRDVSEEIAAIAAVGVPPLDEVVDSLGDQNLRVLASGVAHDFNNLLTVALGVTDLIAEQLGPDSPIRPQLAQVVAASREAAALARQLLTVTGRGATHWAHCEVSALIRGVEGLLRSALPPSIALEVSAPDPLWIDADATQIRQVLLNLVTNAGEAIGPRGGRVSVEASESRGEDGAAVVAIEVRDDGPGMSEQARQRIFEPTFTTKRTGHGLGLAVVKSVVTRHQGSIRVASTPSHGTTFRVELPLLPEAVAVADARMREALQPTGVGGGTVLVVDDNEAVRRLSAALLGLASFSVLEAGDAATARRLVAETPGIACCVVDLVMPDADGLALIEELRALQPGLKIVVCSGAHDRLPTERDDLVALEKPFRYAQLIDAVLRSIAAGEGAPHAATTARAAPTASST